MNNSKLLKRAFLRDSASQLVKAIDNDVIEVYLNGFIDYVERTIQDYRNNKVKDFKQIEVMTDHHIGEDFQD